MESTVNRFVSDLKSQFDNFTPYMAVRVEGGIWKGAFETLRQILLDPKNKTESASVVLPIGTLTADVRTKSDMDNVNVTMEFSKDFIRALNGQLEVIWQDTFDDQFMKNMTDYVMYGFFNPESEEMRPLINDNIKCIELDSTERNFFPNAWCNTLLNLVRDKQRSGKIYSVELTDSWNAGKFTFEFTDEGVIPSFTVDKIAKQYMKNGDIIEADRLEADEL